ncbi:MAG: hypothetical protein QNK20_14960 [Aureibaculum sp.]|nr:hypothetical protein [Aureibaculum sp.]
MNYPIEVLRKHIEKHQKKIAELAKLDHEMFASEVFTQNEIENHEDCITKLQKAIIRLL